MTLVARHGALTDIGLHRKTNEDTFVVEPPLYAVCDGMGGAQAGEVASGLAAETLAAAVAAGRPLLEAAEAANTAVFARANENVAQTGMGTTLTAFALEGDTAHFVHIGDSRAYLLRGGALEQVSDDHSLVGEMVRDGRLTEAEAAVHPHRSILSRALGTEATVRIDEFAVDLRAGDTLLLCSDGLSGPVPPETIAGALARPDPQAAADKLVKEARKRGGPDNITAVVVILEEAGGVRPAAAAAVAGADDPEAGADTAELTAVTVVAAGESPDELPRDGVSTAAPAPEPLAGDESVPAASAEVAAAPPSVAAAAARRRSVRRLGVVAGLLAALTVVVAAGALVYSTVFFIGVDEGRLTVYSGLPGEVGPVRLHAVYRRSVRTYDSLSPEERTIVDARALRGRAEVMDMSEQLEMWP